LRNFHADIYVKQLNVVLAKMQGITNKKRTRRLSAIGAQLRESVALRALVLARIILNKEP